MTRRTDRCVVGGGHMVGSLRSILLLTATCLSVTPALVTELLASQVRPVNLEEMTARATTIFAGRCVRVESVRDPVLGAEVVRATFEVERAIKGNPERTAVVRMLGPDPHGEGTLGVPRFRAGDDVVLFLYGESSLGLTAPVGLGQGRFQVVTDKLGRRLAINDLGNRNLLRGLSSEAEARLAAFDALPHATGLTPKALLDLAEALAEPRP